MSWGNLRFYVRCPKTDKNIYLLSVPQNPYEARDKLKEFSVKCPHCGRDHIYNAHNIYAEPEVQRNWLFGMLFGLFIAFFLSPVLKQMTLIFGVLFVIVGYLVGNAYDMEYERRAIEYESILMEVSEE